MTTTTPSMPTGLTVRITEIVRKAQGVVALELQAADGGMLHPFTAGSHIDVELPVQDGTGNSIVRQYSLCNEPGQVDRYVIGVGLDVASRGGSAWLHNGARLGGTLRVSMPRNHFQLEEDAEDSVLVAGGIGITPLLAMARRLSTLQRRWTLYYCARTPEHAAFLRELEDLPGRVIPVFDGVPGGKPIDLARVVEEAPAHAHLYCCGPTSLMESFQRAAAQRAARQVHVEWFKPPQAAPAANPSADGPFQVALARSGIELDVPADRSILEVLMEAGVPVQHSCCDGVCGTCETRVLEGVPEHRDLVLLGDEATTTERMMVCVSRCVGSRLVLDL